MPNAQTSFDPKAFLREPGAGRIMIRYGAHETLYSQGDAAEAVFHLQRGNVKLTIVSRRGKEAIIGILGPGDFFGEGCLLGLPLRTATACALSDCSVMRLEKSGMSRVMQEEQAFADAFLRYLLMRNLRIEEDLADQLFNCSEKRLARVLLLLAGGRQEGDPEPVIPKISQETLAAIVGTTRSRVSYFMNRFRKLELIDYRNGLVVHASLRTFLSSED